MHLHKVGFRWAYKWTDLQLRASKQAVVVLIKIVCFTFVVFRLQNIIKMILIEFIARQARRGLISGGGGNIRCILWGVGRGSLIDRGAY